VRVGDCHSEESGGSNLIGIYGELLLCLKPTGWKTLKEIDNIYRWPKPMELIL